MSQLSNTPKSPTMLRLEARKSFALDIWFENEDAAPFQRMDITGSTVTFVMAKRVHKGGAQVLNKTLTIDGPLGLARLKLQAADLNLTADTYEYGVVLMTADGYSAMVLKGEVEVLANTSLIDSNEFILSNPPQQLTLELAGRNVVRVRVANLPAPNLSIGEVVRGETASATIEGAYPLQRLNLVLPKGDPGPNTLPAITSIRSTVSDDIAAPGSDIEAALSAKIGEGVEEGVEADADSPDGVITKRGGKTKTDGQNIKNFRRPTLAVDKMFPNTRHDHQIVWVDEVARIAYAIGQDNALRKSVWTYNTDEAQSFGTPTSRADTTHRWCDGGVFLRIPSTGELLMEQVRKSDGLTTLLRSVDDGYNWTTVWTSPAASKRFLGPQTLARDGNTGHLYLVEYTTDTAQTAVSIWRSTDKGATWTDWHSFPRHDSNPGTIRHWHSARYDPISQRMFFAAGDGGEDAGIYRANAAGDGIELVVKNAQLSVEFGLEAPARCVDIMFFPTHIAWPVDGSGGQNYVFRMARSEIGQENPEVDEVAAIDSTGWYVQNASADGSTWVCSTSTEQAGPNPDKGLAHLYAVTDNGSKVDEVATVVMDGEVLGHASVSGLGGGSGSGEAFWMRAHGYQTFPYQTQSAFQFRARLGAGVVQIEKPAPRPVAYTNQTRDSGAVSLAAGATTTFGFTRAPQRATSLYFFDYGAKVLTGDVNYLGEAQMEAWNVSTGIKLFEWAGQSWRYDGGADTAEFYGPFSCAQADQIEFRVTNTGSSARTVSAYAAFGWGF